MSIKELIHVTFYETNPKSMEVKFVDFAYIWEKTLLEDKDANKDKDQSEDKNKHPIKKQIKVTIHNYLRNGEQHETTQSRM